MRVKNYHALAIRSFQQIARGAMRMLGVKQLCEDWDQETAMVALVAERAKMSVRQARNYFSREAWRVLREMGFRRPSGEPAIRWAGAGIDRKTVVDRFPGVARLVLTFG